MALHSQLYSQCSEVSEVRVSARGQLSRPAGAGRGRKQERRSWREGLTIRCGQAMATDKNRSPLPAPFSASARPVLRWLSQPAVPMSAAERLVDYVCIVDTQLKHDVDFSKPLPPVKLPLASSSKASVVPPPPPSSNKISSEPRLSWYQPVLTARYPVEDYADNPLTDGKFIPHITLVPNIKTNSTNHPSPPPLAPLSHSRFDSLCPAGLPLFCMPSGLIVLTEYRLPIVHYFVTTNSKGSKNYACTLTFYEERKVFDPADEVAVLAVAAVAAEPLAVDAISDALASDASLFPSSETTSSPPPPPTDPATPPSPPSPPQSFSKHQAPPVPTPKSPPTILYFPKCLTIISNHCFLPPFREYLLQLYRISTTPNTPLPLERYILNLTQESPAPVPKGHVEVQLQILNSTLKFWGTCHHGQQCARQRPPCCVTTQCLDPGSEP